MEGIIKELKEELLNKEVTLVDLDNTAERITESSTSLFDYAECLEQNSCAYYIKEDKNIIVEWEVIEDAEDKTDIKVKVTDIWED